MKAKLAKFIAVAASLSALIVAGAASFKVG
jgi:hypothetical protein